MKVSFTILVAILLSNTAWTQTQTPVYLSQAIPNANSKGYYEYLPADYAYSGKTYPLLIWVHGGGSTGQGNATDLPKLLNWGVPRIISEGTFPSSFYVGGTSHSFIVISPQFMAWPYGPNVSAMIDYISANYRVDATRIYLVGSSAGGGGIWDYTSRSIANSDRLAAVVPLCGTLTAYPSLASRIASSKLPVWAFHNTYDRTVAVTNSRNWVNYINSFVPATTTAARLTEFPVQSTNNTVAHDCWTLATSPDYKPEGINIYEWLLQYTARTSVPTVPTAPTVPTTPTTGTGKTFKVNIYGGVNPYNNTQWNNWNVAGSLNSGKFEYDDGTASNISAVLSASALIADNGESYAEDDAVECPPEVLRYTSANTSYRTLTFYGMTNTRSYDFEFYSGRTNSGHKTAFKIGNSHDTITTDNNMNDVARFNNIVPDASGKIVVIISRIGIWNYLSGFTVSENSSSNARILTTSVSGTSDTSTLAQNLARESTNMVVYPNPTISHTYLNIPAGLNGAYKVNIMNMNGQRMLQKSGTKGYAAYAERLDFGSLPKGMYIIQLTIENKNMTTTVIKQ